jgi:hypothetical protein
MAFRSEAFGYIRLVGFLLVPAICAGSDALTFAIRGGGTLVVEEDGITFREPAPKKKKDRPKPGFRVWSYPHVQQIRLEDQRLKLVTYEDSPRWRLGVDRAVEFRLADPSKSFRLAAPLLHRAMAERFTAAFSDVPEQPEWSILVKKLGTLKGSEGTLYVAADRVVYASAIPGESRTWWLRDIENVNSSGRFELTLTTYERARMHYGSMRSFNFRLKEPVDPSRVDALWRRLESTRSKY